MKYLSVLAALALGDVARAATCNADNCARAVTGTFRQMTASHYADCSSFMACTVTPAAVTVTAANVVTVTPPAATVTGGNFLENLKKRAVTPIGAITNCPQAVPSYASACSGTSRYSSACSCGGVTKKTVTVASPTITTTLTTTLPVSTVSVAPSPPPLCQNAGLQWAYFTDYQPDYDQADTLAYDPTVIKTYTPGYTGVTDYLSYNDPSGGNPGNVYGQSVDTNFFTLEHRGYLFAPESGQYTFNVSNLDNNWFLWLGSQAYSGWTKENANQDAYLDLTNGYYGQVGSGVYTTTLQAGQYYAIRMVYHNDRGPGTFDYSITAPSGYVLIGSDPNTAAYTPFVVQYSCDGILAPQYPPFGQET